MTGETQEKKRGIQDARSVAQTPPMIAPEAMMIDIISSYRQTEPIFKRLEEETGTCVLCQGLFLSLGDAAEKFGFDLEAVLRNLHAVVAGGDGRIRPPDSTRL